MKTLLIPVLVALVFLGSPSRAATALQALQVIPGADLANLAIVEGHDGDPNPARWHFLFYDQATENGVREYVVEDGKVVAEREVSQFASSLKPTDVMGAAGLTVDSDMVARTARQWADAEGRDIASMSFALRNDGADGGSPIWTVTCFGGDGRAFAEMKVTRAPGVFII